MKSIALDVMGGDFGPPVVVPAALSILRKHKNIELILVGDESRIQQELDKQNFSTSNNLKIQHASEQILSDDPPAVVLRTKKDASMRVALKLVKDGKADAVVSAGNTGALMVLARFILKMLPGVDRPAIIYKLPTITGGQVQMLDLGANVDCSPEHLFQFAVMGSVYAKEVDKIATPRISLLNIGAEAIKGSEVVKKAANVLVETDAVNYTGYVEGDEIFQAKTDVVVCDGFVGNVSLKTAEGVARMVFNTLKKEFTRNWLTKLIGLIALPIFKRIHKRYDLNKLNGASFLGIRGNVIKSHGAANIQAFASAVEVAINESENNLPQKIVAKLEKHFQI